MRRYGSGQWREKKPAFTASESRGAKINEHGKIKYVGSGTSKNISQIFGKFFEESTERQPSLAKILDECKFQYSGQRRDIIFPNCGIESETGGQLSIPLLPYCRGHVVEDFEKLDVRHVLAEYDIQQAEKSW